MASFTPKKSSKYPDPFASPSSTNTPTTEPPPSSSSKRPLRSKPPKSKSITLPTCPPRAPRQPHLPKVLVHPSLTSFTSILKTPACLRNNILAKTHSSTCTCNFKNCSIPLSSFFCCFMINSVYHVISIPGSVNEVLEFESQIIDICEGYKPPADVKELGRFCVGGGDTLRFAYKSSQCLLALSGSVLNENSPYNGNLIVLKGGAGGRGGAKEEDVVVGDSLQILAAREAKYLTWVSLRKLTEWFFKGVSTRASEVNKEFLGVLKADLVYADGVGGGTRGNDVDALTKNVEGLELAEVDEKSGVKSDEKKRQGSEFEFEDVKLPESIRLGHHLCSYLDQKYKFSEEELERDVLLIYLPTLKNGKTKDCWDVPGGKREIGETTFEAALRETEEEAGVRLIGGVEGLRKRGIHRMGEVFWEVYL
ncbi:hypothetical protein TrLO_g4793 [Triparma laevis f. longispina]|uniref:Nudix hydrolase domain-containing protein n=1 Tax=Triparma laevis f. longispina TaxID=1714387 RepID=A0A9W7ECX0_9STRA|nr:hypothetical protein TrLO_g4793 [Triparma laevis f. longispina]